jgi:hypothetical protein
LGNSDVVMPIESRLSVAKQAITTCENS